MGGYLAWVAGKDIDGWEFGVGRLGFLIVMGLDAFVRRVVLYCREARSVIEQWIDGS